MSTEEKKKYICDAICELSFEDILNTYHFMRLMLPIDSFNEHGLGCSINLDPIPDSTIEMIYKLVFVKHAIEHRIKKNI